MEPHQKRRSPPKNPTLANVAWPDLKERRDRQRDAKFCICGPVDGVAKPGRIVHGPVVKAGKCQRCCDVARGKSVVDVYAPLAVAALLFALTGCLETIGRPPEVVECRAVLTCGKDAEPLLEVDGAACDAREPAHDDTLDMCNAIGTTECGPRVRFWRCEVTCTPMPEPEVAACTPVTP